MKTNKTIEDAIDQRVGDIPSLQSAIGRQIAAEFWNAALASVVEEPVLTEAQIFDVIIDNVTDESDDGKWIEERDFFKLAKALRGHIPAIPSDPTPQQEGGLTRERLGQELALSEGPNWEQEFLDRAWALIVAELGEAKKGVSGFEEWYEKWWNTTHNEEEMRIAFAEAKAGTSSHLTVEWLQGFWKAHGGWNMGENNACFEALVNYLNHDVRDYQPSSKSTISAREPSVLTRRALSILLPDVSKVSLKVFDEIMRLHTQALEAVRNDCNATVFTYQQEVSTLHAELAEAKKGRYAIPPGAMEQVGWYDPDEPGKLWNMDEHDDDLSEFHQPLFAILQPKNPTIEQMMESWVKWKIDAHQSNEFDAKESLIRQLIKSKGNLESLWRRDCKGGGK